MSDQNETVDAGESAAERDLFSHAYFAALTGVAGRSAGQDPGSVVNEAFKLAERTLERFSTGLPVDSEAVRDAKAARAAEFAQAGLPTNGSPAVAGNATLTSGRFQRPGTPAP